MIYFTPFLSLLFLSSSLFAITLNPDAHKLFSTHKDRVCTALNKQKEEILNRPDAKTSAIVQTNLLGIDKMLAMLEEMGNKNIKQEITKYAIDDFNDIASRRLDAGKLASKARARLAHCIKISSALQNPQGQLETAFKNHSASISDCMAISLISPLLKDPSLEFEYVS